MSHLGQMLQRIIRDNGNYVTKEQAEECLKEWSKLRNENNINRGIINDTRKLAQEGLKVLAPLYSKKEDKHE